MSCYCCYDREDREDEGYFSREETQESLGWDEEEESARWTEIQEAWDNYKREEFEKQEAEWAEQESALQEEALKDAAAWLALQEEALKEPQEKSKHEPVGGYLARISGHQDVTAEMCDLHAEYLHE